MFSGKGSRYESFGKELGNSGHGRDSGGRGWVTGQGISGFLEGCSVVEVEVLGVSGRSTGDCRVDLAFQGRVRGVRLVQLSVMWFRNIVARFRSWRGLHLARVELWRSGYFNCSGDQSDQ